MYKSVAGPPVIFYAMSDNEKTEAELEEERLMRALSGRKFNPNPDMKKVFVPPFKIRECRSKFHRCEPKLISTQLMCLLAMAELQLLTKACTTQKTER